MQRDDSEREVQRQERLKERANGGTATGKSRKGIDTHADSKGTGEGRDGKG